MRNFYNDTIAAISTAVSSAGIGIVRVTGKESIEIADKVFKGKNNKKLCNQKILILYLFYGIIQWYNIYVKIFISCYYYMLIIIKRC